MDQIAPKDALSESHADGLQGLIRWAFKFKYLSYKSTQAKALFVQGSPHCPRDSADSPGHTQCQSAESILSWMCV